ncbi:uncharacterized protein LY89DRAFT_689828 [Mollisia scopiformis]|uniref:Uncharacterized protein n=1 Tax=Mollisia scopiformis TaxID=149040 RepID=A0A132BC26_MOLSC|nr:uncharacterized protein LY89DRAFT_689828 [Mollisia scopiformis]KUJ09931.1 hypothetical protein LY89DRAFT_689828 [Mollisia scopiformis]
MDPFIRLRHSLVERCCWLWQIRDCCSRGNVGVQGESTCFEILLSTNHIDKQNA